MLQLIDEQRLQKLNRENSPYTRIEKQIVQGRTATSLDERIYQNELSDLAKTYQAIRSSIGTDMSGYVRVTKVASTEKIAKRVNLTFLTLEEALSFLDTECQLIEKATYVTVGRSYEGYKATPKARQIEKMQRRR